MMYIPGSALVCKWTQKRVAPFFYRCFHEGEIDRLQTTQAP